MTKITNPASNLNLAGARIVVDAALAEAATIGGAFCIAVTDASGEPLATVRMDNAPRLSAGIAANKAYSVCGFNGMPTSAWWNAIKDDPSLVHGITNTPRLIVFSGGVGITIEGALVGAIGVSGGSPDQDAQVAKAGARAVS